MHLPLDIVSIECYPAVLLSFPILVYYVEFLSDDNEMVSMLFSHILHAKSINY